MIIIERNVNSIEAIKVLDFLLYVFIISIIKKKKN